MLVCETPTVFNPDGRTGTRAGYTAHRAAKETPCEPCTEANRVYQREFVRPRMKELGGCQKCGRKDRKPMPDTTICLECSNYMKTYYNAIRTFLLHVVGGVTLSCNQCGIEDVPFEFDHIFPEDKEVDMQIKSVPLNDLLYEATKCQLLCEHCHRAKTAQEAAQRATAKQDQLDALINTYQGSEAA